MYTHLGGAQARGCQGGGVAVVLWAKQALHGVGPEEEETGCVCVCVCAWVREVSESGVDVDTQREE